MYDDVWGCAEILPWPTLKNLDCLVYLKYSTLYMSLSSDRSNQMRVQYSALLHPFWNH